MKISNLLLVSLFALSLSAIASTQNSTNPSYDIDNSLTYFQDGQVVWLNAGNDGPHECKTVTSSGPALDVQCLEKNKGKLILGVVSFSKAPLCPGSDFAVRIMTSVMASYWGEDLTTLFDNLVDWDDNTIYVCTSSVISKQNFVFIKWVQGDPEYWGDLNLFH